MSRIDPRPEIRCTINDFITRDYLVFAMKRKEAVHGKIVRIFVREKLVVVFLGNGLYGILSWEEFSIYPFTYYSNNNIPDEILSLNEKVISFFVTHVSSNRITLSRKDHMAETLAIFLSRYKWPVVWKCSVTSVFSESLYLDVGAGLKGFLPCRQISAARINNLANFYHIEDIISCKKIEYDSSRKDFILSFKAMYNPIKQELAKYEVGQIISVRIAEKLSNKSSIYPNEPGYYVEVNPVLTGVLHCKDVLELDKIVSATITKISYRIYLELSQT